MLLCICAVSVAWLSHIPDRGGQTIRYYGFYINATRGRLKKQQEHDLIKEGDDTELSSQEVKEGAKRSEWTQVIQKVYGIDPLICNRCGS